MRLLQITASNVWRGHEQQIVYYYDAFAAKGMHQVLLCTPDTRLHEIAQEKNYRVHTLPFHSEYDRKWMKKINQIVREEKIDLILIHNSTAHTLCVLSSLLYGWKTPMVFFRTLIKRVDTNFFRKWKYNYSGLKKIVCVSQAVIDVLAPAINDKSRLSIVGSATDLEEFHRTQPTGWLRKELGLTDDTVIIGNIAAFVGFKDHVTLVHAAAEIVKKIPKVVFVLAGKGELEENIKALVAEEELTSHFVFLGFRKDIPELFPEFDLFLFTSKLEPTGGVLLEAYASHVPIVATRAGGIPEVVVEGETGLLCEKENPIDFAEKTVQLLQDKAWQQRLVANGYQHLLTHFTKEVIAEAMYHELELVYRAAL